MTQALTYIHPDAKIGKNVTISPFVYIDQNVVIGDDCWIGPHVTLFANTRLGNNCKIFPGAVISAIPQDLKYENEESEVVIGNNVTIRECVTINRGTRYSYKTQIGDNSLLMAYCHVAHDTMVGKNCILSNNVNLAGHIVIGDFVVIGGVSGVKQFAKIGSHVFIAGGSMVRKDIPPYVKAAREPLSYVGINSIGLRRRGFNTEEIHHIQDIYRILYVRGYSTSKALAIIEAEVSASVHRDEILAFVRTSQDGIMKGFMRRYENNT